MLYCITSIPRTSTDQDFISMKKQLFAVFSFLLLQMPLVAHAEEHAEKKLQLNRLRINSPQHCLISHRDLMGRRFFLVFST